MTTAGIELQPFEEVPEDKQEKIERPSQELSSHSALKNYL
jgi:hypothetical protein